MDIIIVCAECLCGWLQCQDSLACPCCYSDHLRDYSTIKAAVISSIGSLCVICHKCNQHVQLNLYSDHSCKPLGMQVSPQTSVDYVLQQPTTAPLTAIEVKLQTSLARRSLGSSTENVLQLKTGGKVSKTIRIKNALSRYCTCTFQPLTFVQVRQASPHWKSITNNSSSTVTVSHQCPPFPQWRRQRYPAGPRGLYKSERR